MKWQSFDRLFTLQCKKKEKMAEDSIKKMPAWDVGGDEQRWREIPA